jgi:potassium efflux system protein
VQRLYRLIFWSGGRPLPKGRMFVRIIVLLAVLTGIASGLTRITLLTENESDYLRIAVVGPMSGSDEAVGRAMRQGVQLFLDKLNNNGGLDGVKFAAMPIDDAAKPAEAAAKAAADPKVEAVVGHWRSAALQAASAAYDKAEVVAITPSSTDGDVLGDSKWTFSTLYSTSLEARFLANYARNVLGNQLTSIIFDTAGPGAAMAENYEATYLRFGTAVRYKWSFDSTAANAQQQIDGIINELKDRKDAGILFMATGEADAATLLKKLRDARVRNPIIAPNVLATASFRSILAGQLPPTSDVAQYTNGMLVSAPLLFDTANEGAQNFLDGYIAKFHEQPDWVAAYAYDSAAMLMQAIKANMKDGKLGDTKELRAKIRDFLADKRSFGNALSGISGETYFDEKGLAQKPVLVGVYNGKNIISALTQLQPIKTSATAGTNFIEELQRGRVLYVNDRFMYKTNVVYTGVQVNELSGLNAKENTFTLDFLIWFRYRGKFEPQDLQFANAVDPIKLEKPVDERVVDDLTYRLYKVKGKFAFDFTDTFRQYGTHVAGISLTHNSLNENNLLYVKDVLGMGLDSGATVLDKIKDQHALNPNLGFLIDRAWVSQDIVAKGTKGNPDYVGYGSADPAFSKVDLGILVKPDEFNARDFIPNEFFIYIGIFGLLGALFAIGMDRKEKGRFWALQSWCLRLVAWPALLIGGGNIALDMVFKNVSSNNAIDTVVMVYSLLWWFVPARLVAIAAERFVWQPLEDHTERSIPNVIRVFGSVVIYSFAGFGVIAFVFDQQLTSLLASTGLLAMIIGLAIQANISNIFSGIVINLERPFHVGDWVKIGETEEGKVVDITWRTTRVMTRNGYVLSVPNGQVSEAHIHNYDSFDCVRLELAVELDGTLPPRETGQVLQECLNEMPDILENPEREVRFHGVEWKFGAWVGNYELEFWIDDYGSREAISENVLERIYHALHERGIGPSAQQVGLKNAAAPPALGDLRGARAGE